MPSRRSFIRNAAAVLGGLALHRSVEAALPTWYPDPHAPEEDFWRQVRLAYATSPNLINLNNGGVSPMPRAAMDALDYYTRMCSEAPSYYMWRTLDQNREPLREHLAALGGADPEEIAINRNATEALNTIIFGLPLQRGDEVVLSHYDYPNMMHAWRQREKRDGIKLVWVDIKLPSEDREALTRAYTERFTSRTKLVHATHLINWSGQIMPVADIAEAAHKRGIEVLVDAAHSFALMEYNIPDLGADYWGTSLHKWLCAPYGTGMMWVRKEKIGKIWPLLCHENPESGDIRKFETLGTRSFPTEMAIGYSLDLHNLIGAKRKQQRLHYLKNYWMTRVQDLPGIQLRTSLHPDWGCAIGTFGIEGMKAGDIASRLHERYKIHTVAIEWRDLNVVRVTPNVYTTTEELDKLVRAIREMS